MTIFLWICEEKPKISIKTVLNDKNMLKEFMQSFAKEMNVEMTFETSIEGVYELPLDETTSVKVLELPPGFSFQCDVCPCPMQNEELLFTTMLLGNLFGKGTLGAVLGLTDDGKIIRLTMDLDYDVSYKEFRNKLEDFLNSVDFWREEATVIAQNSR